MPTNWPPTTTAVFQITKLSHGQSEQTILALNYAQRLVPVLKTMMTGNRKVEGRVPVCTILLHAIRKSPMPSKNKLAAILNRKSLGLSWDSNLACSDWMPPLYLLRHHLCHWVSLFKRVKNQPHISNLFGLQFFFQNQKFPPRGKKIFATKNFFECT